MAELDELSMAMSRLEATAMALDQQLTPVKNMARVPPSGNSTGQAIASICPLGQSIRDFTAKVNTIHASLATLRDTIEI